MKLHQYFLAGLRVINRKLKHTDIYTTAYCDYKDQAANDFVYRELEAALNNKTPYMIGKFGTYELDTMLYFLCSNKGSLARKDMISGVRHIYWDEIKKHLPNTGFFPLEEEYAKKFQDLMLDSTKQLDILASYMKAEKYLDKELSNCKKVNLEGYYAPFMWENPWTKLLKDKKVLVIHPFASSIESQYKNREKLFGDPEVLPEFKKLTVIQAVQSIAGNKPENFDTWFDALHYMEKQIDEADFDIALIGCGAYGFPLSAYCKKIGKIAVHMAGWTQMLFGIYGERWLKDQPEFAKYINQNWIRPGEQEKPKNFSSIEGGCYW